MGAHLQTLRRFQVSTELTGERVLADGQKLQHTAVTSAVVGSIVNAPPPGCRPVNYGGIVYQQCGNTWYMPQGAQFVVVNPPY